MPLFCVAERRKRVAQGKTLGGLFEQFGSSIRVSILTALPLDSVSNLPALPLDSVGTRQRFQLDSVANLTALLPGKLETCPTKQKTLN